MVEPATNKRKNTVEEVLRSSPTMSSCSHFFNSHFPCQTEGVLQCFSFYHLENKVPRRIILHLNPSFFLLLLRLL